MLRLILATFGSLGARALCNCPARESFSSTVLAWQPAGADGERQAGRAFPVDNFS